MKGLSLQNWHKWLFAWGMAKANTADDRTIKLHDCQDYATMAALKRSLLTPLQGTVLEIGPGAGANLSYYSPDIHWIGVEPNPFMHPYIYQEAERHGFTAIELYGEQAETLPVAANSIDTVVSTYVLCSVSDVDATLKDIQRVLKPGGTFVFIEHVAASENTCTRTVQDGITPVWKTVFDHCHPNRETWLSLEKVGFESIRYQSFRLSVPVVSPHIAGIATQKSANNDAVTNDGEHLKCSYRMRNCPLVYR
nr:MAG: class I SAM-dependent methyltransferase [Leptolyngbya sp. IPPAS B-1204]